MPLFVPNTPHLPAWLRGRIVALAVTMTIASAMACTTSPKMVAAQSPPETGQSTKKTTAVRPNPGSSPSAEASLPANPLTARLALAVEALRNGRQTAAPLLEAYRTDDQLVDDVVLFLLAEATASADRSVSSAYLRELLGKYPSSFLATRAALALAENRIKDGALREAVDLADKHAMRGSGSVTKASLCLAVGRALASTEPARAARYLARAREQAPGTEIGGEARSILQDLRRRHESLALTSMDAMYAEATLLGREGQNEQKAALLGELLRRYPKGGKTHAAILERAAALGRSGNKPAAADYLQRMAAEAGSAATRARYLYEAAYQRWNADQNDEAKKLFERFLALNSRIPQEQSAHYALGRIHQGLGHYDEAVRAFSKAGAGGDAKRRVESRWQLGWTRYLQGDFTAASAGFGDMAASASPRSAAAGRAEALYWQARSLEKLSKTDEADRIYRRLIDEFPIGYYAYMVERRRGLKSPHAAWTVEAMPRAELSGSAARAVARAQRLAGAGLAREAAEDLTLRAGALDTSAKKRLLPHLPDLGAYKIAFTTAVSLNSRGSLSAAQSRPFLYPRAYRASVERLARERGIEPYLVYSVMRQESAFDPHVVSPARAHGLLQLLESTAKRTGARVGRPNVTVEQLFQPDVNVDLGIAYLAELSARYGGEPIFVLAAYNAGEKASDRWSKIPGDADEVIEQISYRETRDYVKKVLRNQRNYRRVYER